MYGKVVYIILAVFAYQSAFAGLQELLSLWMINLAYATLHWCQTGFLVFVFGMSAITTMTKMTAGWTFMLMFIYNVIGTVIAWKAAKLFHTTM